MGGGGKFSAPLPQDFLGHFLKFSEKRTTVEQIRAKQGHGGYILGVQILCNSLSSWVAETAGTINVFLFNTSLALVSYIFLWVSLFILVSERTVSQSVVCASREATHWPECFLHVVPYSCAHAVVKMQEAKGIISAVQHHCLAVQNTELVLTFASYCNNMRGKC